MTSVLEKHVSSCTRVRLLKVLLFVLGAVVFLEYISGFLTDGRRAITFYSSNTSVHRVEQQLQWPKRTHGRHCFDDHVHAEKIPVPFIAVNNITIRHKDEKGASPNVTNASDHSNGEIVNVHNATQRSVVFKEDEFNSNGTFDMKTVSNVSDVNTSNMSAQVDNSESRNVINISDGNQNLIESSSETGCDVPCPPVPPNLEGPVSPNLTEITLNDLEGSHLDVEEGGRFAPRNCKPHNRVAIIVPYRDRESHLAMFLNNMHPFLMKQQIDYQIFIVEQKGKTQFNRASLMNVGFIEAMKRRPWDCFIFHDVDLIPLDDRNLYTCPQQPRHLSAAIDKFNFKLPYKTIFGGVSVLTVNQFQKVNGFSNTFWGWGGEDDDMANRIAYHNFHISRYPMSIARYTMLDHEKEKPNQERYNLLTKGKLHFNTEGLNTLQYTLVSSQLHRLYTQLLVEIHPPS